MSEGLSGGDVKDDAMTPVDKKREPPSPEGLGFVMDVPVELTVEIGRRTMKIAEVLSLGPGSILELDKAAGEPLDVRLNDRLVARGEAVVIGDRYGVRITEVFAGRADSGDRE